MKRIVFIVVILLSAFSLQAQKDADFYHHELRASFGPSLISNAWIRDGTIHSNVSVAYFYRPVKWFWAGASFINYFGNNIHYNWREYESDGSYKDYSNSKMKHCYVIAPEIRFSYLNRKGVILYSALSGGIGIENGYNRVNNTYPEINGYFQITFLGVSINFGENKNIFLGGESGLGYKGFNNFHGGYRF